MSPAQLRANFYGAEALREQRGRNEMKVMVRLPEGQRSSEYDLQQLRIRTPRGAMVPLEDVVDIKRGKAPTSIKREAGLPHRQREGRSRRRGRVAS